MAEKKGKGKGTVNSVLTPTAQTATPHALRNASGASQTASRLSDTLPTDLTHVDRAVIELLEATGARVSEVCNLPPTAVAKNGTIKLKGLKGSKNRIIPPGTWSAWFVNNRLSLPISDYGFNRHYYYRLFKRLGIYAQFGNSEKQSVTHYFRHRLAADLRESDFDLTDLANALGHKKESNANRYGRGKNERR